VNGEKRVKWELLSSARTVRLVENYLLDGPCSMKWGKWKVHINWSDIRK
jgi:hypothetical protein